MKGENQKNDKGSPRTIDVIHTFGTQTGIKPVQKRSMAKLELWAFNYWFSKEQEGRSVPDYSAWKYLCITQVLSNPSLIVWHYNRPRPVPSR